MCPSKLEAPLISFWSKALSLSFLLVTLLASTAVSAAVDMRVNSVADSTVEVHATVTDSSGNFITNLSQDDFEISEQGAVQTITSFSPPASSSNQDQVSLSVVFVIDDSGSLAGVHEDIQNSVISFVRSMNLNDQVGIVKFRGDVIANGFAAVDPANTTAIEEWVLAPVNQESSSVIFDATIQSLNMFDGANLPSGPTAVVLLTDGHDLHSTATEDDLINEISTSGIPVFPIGFGDINTETMTHIAEESGTDFVAAQDGNAFELIQLEMAKLLQNSYSLTYTSNGECPDIPVSLKVTGQSVQEVDRCASNRSPRIQSEEQKRFSLGEDVSMAIKATDPDPDDTLTFSATGLPPGLSIDAQTGVISGTPTKAGNYVVHVAATDGSSTSRIAFTTEIVDDGTSDSSSGGGGAFGLYGLALLLLIWTAGAIVPGRRSR